MTTILAVDDEHDILLALELLLEDEGYRLVTAANGKEALARLAERKPALVLMDVMMPVMGGLDTLRVMKDDPDYREIPVVMMSAVSPKVSREDYPWDHFLQKPFDVDTLLDLIRKLIGGGARG